MPCKAGCAPKGPARVRGFAFVASLFLLVVLGAFAAYIINIGANAQGTVESSIQAERAFEAANSGLEWAAYQELDPSQAIWGQVTTPPNCFASPSTPTLPSAFGAITLSISCTRYPAWTATPNYYEEGSQRVVVYVITSTASYGTAGNSDYVQRQLQSRVVQCKNPFGTAPAYTCSNYN
jgi:MSHA biogenesis protein MshP